MTARTCHLHVGTPKTGSTTIQGFLQTRWRELARRGLDVPMWPDRSVVQGGRALAYAIRRERDPDALETDPWIWLDRHLSATEGDLVISRESLSTEFLTPARVAFVSRFFARRGVRLHVVAYVRDTAERVNSAYTQHAKNLRMPLALDDWAAPIRPEANPKFSPWRVFRHALADEGMVCDIRSFERVKTRLLRDFLETIGHGDAASDDFDDTRYRNATPGPKQLAAGVLLARMIGDRRSDRQTVRAFRAAFAEAVAARGWDEKPFFGVTPALANRLHTRYDAENERFAAAAWGAPWPEAIGRRLKPLNVIEPGEVRAQAEIDDVVRETRARAEAALKPWRRTLTAMRERLGL
jgi:hypothetical protein